MPLHFSAFPRDAIPTSICGYGDLLLIAIQSVIQSVFFFLTFGLPVLAFVLGLYVKPRVLVAAYVGQLAIMTVTLATLSHLLETGRYPNSTGMEGIALVGLPVMYLASLLASMVAYFAAVWISKRRQRP